jgi:hypothetical protein
LGCSLTGWSQGSPRRGACTAFDDYQGVVMIEDVKNIEEAVFNLNECIKLITQELRTINKRILALELRADLRRGEI